MFHQIPYERAMISMNEVIRLTDDEFIQIGIDIQHSALSMALNKVIMKASMNAKVEELVDSFFVLPEQPSEEHQKFFNGLPDVLYFDEANNRYEFKSDAVKERLLHEAIGYHYWLESKYGVS